MHSRAYVNASHLLFLFMFHFGETALSCIRKCFRIYLSVPRFTSVKLHSRAFANALASAFHYSGGLFQPPILIWQPLTLPHRLQCSTISRPCLNRRVRDVYGCSPRPHYHQKSLSALFFILPRTLNSETSSLLLPLERR